MIPCLVSLQPRCEMEEANGNKNDERTNKRRLSLLQVLECGRNVSEGVSICQYECVCV